MRWTSTALVLAGCASGGEPGTTPGGSAPSASAQVVAAPSLACTNNSPSDRKTPIGTAKMEADGTIVLDIRRPAMTLAKYDPKHTEYASIKAHVDPIKPGESKALLPFPDEVDDAKVEASVCAFASGKNDWGKGPVKFEIMGTSTTDRSIIVSVWSDSKRRSLVLEPKTYAVRSAEER